MAISQLRSAFISVFRARCLSGVFARHRLTSFLFTSIFSVLYCFLSSFCYFRVCYLDFVLFSMLSHASLSVFLCSLRSVCCSNFTLAFLFYLRFTFFCSLDVLLQFIRFVVFSVCLFSDISALARFFIALSLLLYESLRREPG